MKKTLKYYLRYRNWNDISKNCEYQNNLWNFSWVEIFIGTRKFWLEVCVYLYCKDICLNIDNNNNRLLLLSGPSTGDAFQCNNLSVVLLDLITCETKNNKKVICHSYTAPSQTNTWTRYTMAIQRPNNCCGYAHSEMGEKAITKNTI